MSIYLQINHIGHLVDYSHIYLKYRITACCILFTVSSLLNSSLSLFQCVEVTVCGALTTPQVDDKVYTQVIMIQVDLGTQ